MNKTYFQDIAKHFLNLTPDQIPDPALKAARRGLLNYVGGTVYAASHDCCRPLVSFFENFHPESGNASVWGDPVGYTPAVAAFCNAARLSTLELNDGTAASAHPGIYVWSGIFAEIQEHPANGGDVLRAVLFGYETATRMAKLSLNRILELGLHNPGFVGGLGTASAVGLLKGLSLEQLENAFGMTASLTPLCPFVSFVEGADTKDFYGGWGTYLGMTAANATAAGLTGPKSVLNGVKSLESIFQGETGLEIPIGDPYMITSLGVKQYPACFAVNPAVNAVLTLRRQYGFSADDVESVILETYPYSYDLSTGVGLNLNRTSAKLSIPYSAAAALRDGTLTADAFLDQAFADGALDDLVHRITVRRHDAYGTGDDAVRGCIAEITLKDGQTLRYEYDNAKHKLQWTDELLRSRYFDQVKDALRLEDAEHLYDLATTLSPETPFEDIFSILNRVRRIEG